MGRADDGFVALLSRGPRMSRYYLQCALSEDRADWPDQRIWDEIRLRVRDLTLVNDTVHDKDIVALRSVVHVPMQYRNLFRRRCCAPRACRAPPVRPGRVVDLNRASDGGGAGHANIAATLIGRSIRGGAGSALSCWKIDDKKQSLGSLRGGLRQFDALYDSKRFRV
jgi:hypothetical protein